MRAIPENAELERHYSQEHQTKELHDLNYGAQV